MKYTRKLSTWQNRIYLFLQFAVFIPLLYGITQGDAGLMRLLWPPIIALALFGVIYRLISYCQLTDDALQIMPGKIDIPYPAITFVTEVDKDGLEIEYVDDEGAQKLCIFLTMRDAFIFELDGKRKAR